LNSLIVLTTLSTSLLLKMEGEDNSTSFLDDSINKVPVTAYGNAKITTSESKFGSSSASFDGTNSYLIADISSGFDFGVADFTIEFFAKFNSLSGTQFLIDFRRSGFNTTESYIQAVNTGLYYGYSSSNRISYSSGLQTGVWYHIAGTKTSGSIRMFINGMQVGSTYTDSFTHDRTTYITIGRNSRDASSYFNGYIDQLRITKGFARYIGNFTPPSLELPIESLVSSSSYDENFEKVSLLLHMDGTNSSTIFQDSSINNFSATVYGNTSLRVNQKLFGFSSAYFDGNGDYLGYGYNYDLDLIGGPFTIECWVYLPGYKPSGMRVASSGGGSVSWNGTNGIHWLFGISSTGTLNFQYWNGSSNGSFSSTSVSP
ncbi:MAG: LamG domain-containing protein, partial [Minisyncoccia bacterium]